MTDLLTESTNLHLVYVIVFYFVVFHLLLVFEPEQDINVLRRETLSSTCYHACTSLASHIMLYQKGSQTVACGPNLAATCFCIFISIQWPQPFVCSVCSFFCTTMSELSRCDRYCLPTPEAFTIWSFTEQVCQSLLQRGTD